MTPSPSSSTAGPAPTAATTRGLQGHISIGTSDLARSREFYRALFDAEPVLERPDYVRFWPEELGQVVALNLRAEVPADTGALQHLGLLFPDSERLLDTRRRLAASGFSTRGKEHIECCYAELDQFWATDPSGVSWELFLSHQEVVAPASGKACASSTCCPA